MGGGAGEVRWNKDTESWEPVERSGRPAPPRPRGPGRRLVWGVLGGAVAAGVALALVLTLVLKDDGNGGRSSSTVGASQGGRSAFPSEDPPAEVSESPEAAVGYRPVDDPSGFSTVVPEDWTRSEKKGGAVVFYTSPDGSGDLLQIFQVTEKGYTPDRALDVAARDLSSREHGFEEISRGPVAAKASASELVYAYDNKETGERVKAVDRVFRVGDGRLYAIIVRGAPDDWAVTREILKNARSAFTPD